MHEITKNNPLFVAFAQNELSGTQLVFLKRRFQGLISEILRVISQLEEKFISFCQLSWDKQNFKSFS